MPLSALWPWRKRREAYPCLLGAILAGGRASRFGSDKALARLANRPLIDHVAQRLGLETDAVVVCGRTLPGYTCLPDAIEGGQGPLAGLLAALQHAQSGGYDAVLSVPCDVPYLPWRLARRLAGDGAAIVASHPVIGRWPAELADPLAAYLSSVADRSMRGWATASGARVVALGEPVCDVDMPEDLAELEREWALLTSLCMIR